MKNCREASKKIQKLGIKSKKLKRRKETKTYSIRILRYYTLQNKSGKY